MKTHSIFNSTRRFETTLSYLEKTRSRIADATPGEYSAELATVDEALVTLTAADSPASFRDLDQKVPVPLDHWEKLCEKAGGERQTEADLRSANRWRFGALAASTGTIAGLQSAGYATAPTAIRMTMGALGGLNATEIKTVRHLLMTVPQLRKIALATGLQVLQAPLMAVSILTTPLAFHRGSAIVRDARAAGAAETRLDLLQEVESARELGREPDLKRLSQLLGHRSTGAIQATGQLGQLITDLQEQRSSVKRDSAGVYTPQLQRIDRLSSKLSRRRETTTKGLERNLQSQILGSKAVSAGLGLSALAVTAGNAGAQVFCPASGFVATIVSHALCSLFGAGDGLSRENREKTEEFLRDLKTSRAQLPSC
jgi:hypothetical protein